MKFHSEIFPCVCEYCGVKFECSDKAATACYRCLDATRKFQFDMANRMMKEAIIKGEWVNPFTKQEQK